MTPERVLITGGGGQLASELEALLAPAAAVAAPPHAELDIADPAAVDAALTAVEPQLVLNCAAFHNVDVCEREDGRAWEVNVQAVMHLARRCAERGAKLVHFSSNYVFDGTAEAPYGEDDVPSPRSVYALTKLAGEHAALAYAPGALVVRGAGLYGLTGSASKGGNFVQRMSARAREQGELKMVADQRLQPTFTVDLAAAVLDAVERDGDGVVHLTAGGECSWFEFTRAILEIAAIDAPVHPVDTVIPPGGVDRPLNGVLARPRADALGVPPLRHWREALADYMSRAGLAAAQA